LAAVTDDGRLLLHFERARTNFLTGEVTLTPTLIELGYVGNASHVLISASLRDLFVVERSGLLHYYDISHLDAARLVRSERAFDDARTEVTAAAHLLGAVSLIIGGSDGSVRQWFLTRDQDKQRQLTMIRAFKRHRAPVTMIAPELSRKGFVTGDATGNIALHYPTSHNTLLRERIAQTGIIEAAISPRNNALFVTDAAGVLRYFDVRNEHPDFSLSALWHKVWYENRDAPEYVWQSSSATDEFESKYSLVPLTVGTLKAAFYAMLFAMPLSIMGAVYSAYFMSRRMRGWTKPTIEIMEALPTVILGFLAGLWFAPYVEHHLPAMFSILLLMPLSFLAVSLLWTRPANALRTRIGMGWEAALLIPVVLLVGWFCISLSPWMELWFFGGDMRQWLTDVGINYEQRNAMIVGVAMGFAVIPNIYSIAEDAVFNVPKHLTQGSLALGATTWQTVTRVVLLTASPGIFAALMIGFGRAIGETMIVLMATGNSPVVNFNIFEGLRTLSANIAVEMPEAEYGSTHYRILFLSALVLFVFTFVVNTLAEMVRQRLRRRYSAI
jgi:phosphate transport system permease protein